MLTFRTLFVVQVFADLGAGGGSAGVASIASAIGAAIVADSIGATTIIEESSSATSRGATAVAEAIFATTSVDSTWPGIFVVVGSLSEW